MAHGAWQKASEFEVVAVKKTIELAGKILNFTHHALGPEPFGDFKRMAMPKYYSYLATNQKFHT